MLVILLASGSMDWAYLDAVPPFGLAHRGGRGLAPENTIAAFENAVSLGYRYLETDVHATADGVLVAFHDDQLERVAGLPGGISDYEWSRLSEIRLDGEHPIPRLTELLERFPTSRFNIDPKADGAVDLLIDVIREFDAVSRVCIGSFSEERISRVREALGPELCTSPGPGGAIKVLLASLVYPRWRPPYGCLQIPAKAGIVSFGSAWLINRFHGLGLQVHFWTINEAAEMERLLNNGADAIITDEVETLKGVLERRGATVG